MKIIENKTDNPYEGVDQINFVSKKPTVHEGRAYYLLTYRKEYKWNQRLNRLARIILPTILSCGLILFKENYSRKWKIVLYGQREKELLVPRKLIKIFECSIHDALELENFSERANEMQKELDGLQIPLNCKQPAVLSQPNELHQDKIDAFLDEIENPDEKVLMERLFHGIDLITEEELKEALSVCCEKLNACLKGKSYAIGFVPHKSQQWIAELALPHLYAAPSHYFENATDSGGGTDVVGHQSNLDQQENHYIVFDDASYSGAQLETLIIKFKEACDKADIQEKVHLYLAVPFLSSHAEERLKNSRFLVDEVNVKVHLITTDRKIRTVSDVFTDEELQDLVKATGNTTGHGGTQVYCEGRKMNKCLSIMEWKIPDNQSVPSAIKYQYIVEEEGEKSKLGRLPLITNYPPPYKQGLKS